MGRHKDGVEMGAEPGSSQGATFPERPHLKKSIADPVCPPGPPVPLLAKSSCLHSRQAKDAMLAEARTSRARAWVSPRKRNLAVIRLDLVCSWLANAKNI